MSEMQAKARNIWASEGGSKERDLWPGLRVILPTLAGSVLLEKGRFKRSSCH